MFIHTHTITYPIYIEKGCIQSLANKINVNRKVAIITDENIPIALVNKVKEQCPNCFVYTSISGEEAKSLTNYEAICEFLLSHAFSRSDLLIALGGGVIGDLTGFVAATYMRGIEFVNIPTSTLSQIDSSIGGKVAINLKKTKNSIGAFYPPIAVFIDFEVLESLPKRHYYNGLVEALKAGLIYDASLFEIFEKENIEDNLETIIKKALEVKKEVVEIDEFETGLRKILNFGHTIGHGIESYYNLEDVLHGEAVALGMLQVIDDANIKQRVLPIYEKMHLKTAVTYDVDEVYHYIINDKKAKNDSIALIKLEKIGKAVIVNTKLEDVKKILEDHVCQA